MGRLILRGSASGGGGGGGDPTVWTTQTPSYLSIIPNAAGFGFDTGGGFRPATGGASNWYLITSTGSSTTLGSPVDTRTYECTLPAALEHNVSNKVIINLTSGLFDLTSLTELNLMGDNISMIGFTCRAGSGYGNAIKLRSTIYCRGGHSFIAGWRIFGDTSGTVGPYPSGDQRDNITMGWNPNTAYHVLANCEFYHSSDESVSFFDSATVASLYQSAVCSPIANGIHPDGRHNYGVISGYGLTSFSGQRNAIFHAAARLPLAYSTNTAWCNNLIYNISDGIGNSSQCMQFDLHTSDPSPVAHKVACGKNLILNGPEGYTDNWPITAANQQSGTEIYAPANRQMGFNNVSTEDTFLGNSSGHDARQWRVTSMPSGAAPAAWGSSLEYCDDITASTAGYLAYVTKFRNSCGLHPKNRPDSRMTDLFTQAENYINTTGSGYGAVTSTASYPTLTTFTIDPTNSSHVTSYWAGNTMPSVATRDSLTGGAGTRTYGEEWVRAIFNKDYGA